MSCAQAAVREPPADPVLTLRSRPRRIALVGNANVGNPNPLPFHSADGDVNQVFANIGAIVYLSKNWALAGGLRYSNIPSAMRGLGITMLVTGLMAMAFMIFSGISLGH